MKPSEIALIRAWIDRTKRSVKHWSVTLVISRTELAVIEALFAEYQRLLAITEPAS